MSDITVNNFKAFYEQIRPYLGAAHAGFTPIGTIISVMGTTAPLNYLACDGTVYNIADYTELAAYFNQQFGSSNFFGGNGTTTFAVPDLRGEFLRGTGTNSHANQGSGAAVGVHQDGTEIPNVFTEANVQIRVNTTSASASNYVSKVDSDFYLSTGQHYAYVVSSKGYDSSNVMYKYTSRPTNTSVLYCIASKNIFMDAGSNYSTEEQVVGTWIDGSYLHQKTVEFPVGSLPAGGASKSKAHNIANLGIVVSSDFIVTNHVSPYYKFALAWTSGSNMACVRYTINNTDIAVWVPGDSTDLSGWFGYCTFRYTKSS